MCVKVVRLIVHPVITIGRVKLVRSDCIVDDVDELVISEKNSSTELINPVFKFLVFVDSKRFPGKRVVGKVDKGETPHCGYSLFYSHWFGVADIYKGTNHRRRGSLWSTGEYWGTNHLTTRATGTQWGLSPSIQHTHTAPYTGTPCNIGGICQANYKNEPLYKNWHYSR